MEMFVIKNYEGDGHPTIKGNGIDGLIIGEEREEAEEFIDAVNKAIFNYDAIWEERKAVLKFIEQINYIMCESYLVKDADFGMNEGKKIMDVLHEWASKY